MSIGEHEVPPVLALAGASQTRHRASSELAETGLAVVACAEIGEMVVLWARTGVENGVLVVLDVQARGEPAGEAHPRSGSNSLLMLGGATAEDAAA